VSHGLLRHMQCRLHINWGHASNRGTRNKEQGVMYQPKRFAISLSAISLYPSAISLSVDVRSRLSQLTCGAVAGTGPRCPRRGAPRCVARDSPADAR